MGKETTSPSLLQFAAGLHSVSFLHFATRIDELHFGHHHQSQISIMAMRIIAHIVFPPPSSTSTPSSPSFVLLPNCLQAAQPPILSTRCFGIDACPSNFASNVKDASGGGGGHRWQGCGIRGGASRNHDV